MAVLAIDPGTSAGFALLIEGRVVWCRQIDTEKQTWDVACSRFRGALVEAYTLLIARFGPDFEVDVVMEAPCYQANRRRAQGTESGLAERVGMIRALCFGVFGRAPADFGWREWQSVAHKGRVLGSSEDRSLRYAREVLRVPDAWLMGARGGVLLDAATACAIGGAWAKKRTEKGCAGV